MRHLHSYTPNNVSCLAQDSYKAVMNFNENGEQTVNHIYLHVLVVKAMGWPSYQYSLKSV